MASVPPDHKARALWIGKCLDYLYTQCDENDEFIWVDIERLVAQFSHYVPTGMAARRLVTDRYTGAYDTESDLYPAKIVLGQKRIVRHSLIRSKYVELSTDKKQVRYALRHGKAHT